MKNKLKFYPCRLGNGLHRIVKIMKLTGIIILAALMQVTASVYSQTKLLTLKVNNTPIESALKEIQKQSEFFFLYNNKQIDVTQKIDINVTEKTVEDVLKTMLKGTGIHYLIKDKQIVLYSGDLRSITDVLAESHITQQQEKTVSGTVTDSGGQPLPGVSIVIKGTTQGTVTNTNGEYSLTNVSSDATLVFSFVGMRTQEIEVGNQSNINMMMEEVMIDIEEVVAVGYGTQKKENLTGAVDVVSAEILENRPVKSLAEGMQGVIPGVNITVSDGNPSRKPTVNIRGYTSINGGGPLVLIDGIPMNIDMINFEDVESISVLKDASSAAIYGARASYGVILVTTKSGATGDPIIQYNSNFQMNKPILVPEFIGSYPLILATNESNELRDGVPLYSDQQVSWVKEYYEDPENTPVYHIEEGGRVFWNGNFKAMKRLLNDWYSGHKHTISINGGTQKLSYYASAGYQKNDGMIKINTDVYKQYSTLLKLESTLSKWFKMGLQLSYNKDNYDEPFPYLNFMGQSQYTSYQTSRYHPVLHMSKSWSFISTGAPLFTPDYSPVGEGIPVGETDAEYYVGGRQVGKKQRSFIKLNSEINLVKGFTLHTDFSYINSNFFVKGEKVPVDFVLFSFDSFSQGWTAPGFIGRQISDSDYFTFNSYLNWRKELNNHNFSGIIGYNQEWNENSSFVGQGNEIITSNLPVIRLTSGEQFVNDSEGHWAISGAFFRFTYDYAQRYLFELNGRYDGTSRFPKESRFSFFPSFSAAWRISEENFFKPISKIINYSKIRASYGQLGNQNVPNYLYIPSMSVNSQINYLMGNSRPLGVNNPGLVSADLTWETVTSFDIGIDMTIWDRVNLSYDWYQRNTTDMLTAGQALPAVLGTGVPRENNAEMKTIGWEFTAGWQGKSNYGLLYNIDFVLSDYQGTITKFDGNPNKLNTTYYEGRKLGEIWGYETVGLFQSVDEINSSANQNQLGNAGKWIPGEVRYADLNNDGVINWGDNTIDNPGDRKIIGNSTPRYSYGVNTKIAYKNFDLGIFFQGIGKKDIVPDSGGDVGSLFWGPIVQKFPRIRTELFENRWTEENPDAYYPIFKSQCSWNALPQTRYLQSGAYLRLKNISIGYTLPYDIVNKVGISKLYFYFSGQNLWEHTSLPDGFDPESLSNSSTLAGNVYPFPRIFSFGLNLNL
jgi:TonB-linked SusC/RagA family outer membrane protein